MSIQLEDIDLPPVRPGRCIAYDVGNAKIIDTIGQSPRPTDFHGRSKFLEQIDRAFFPQQNEAKGPSRKRPKCILLSGAEDYGKTSLALTYGIRNRDRFDVVMRVDARSREALEDSYTSLRYDLGIETEFDGWGRRYNDSSGSVTKTWLSNPMMARAGCTRRRWDDHQHFDRDLDPDRRASWLLIFEGFSNLETLADFLPAGDHGCIIFTTATGDITTPSGFPEPLLTIDRSPSHGDERAGIVLELLAQITKLEDVICVGDLKESRMAALGGLVDDILSSPAVVAGIVGRSLVPVTMDLSTWEQHLSKPALALLQVLSFLRAPFIDETFLAGAEATLAIMPDYPGTQDLLAEACGELWCKGLVDYSVIDAPKTSDDICIEPLLRRVVCVASLVAGGAPAAVEATLSLISRSWPFVTFDSRYHAERLAKCKHLFHQVAHIKPHLDARHRNGTLKLPIEYAAITSEVAWYMFEVGEYTKCREFLSMCLAGVLDGIPERERREDQRINRIYSKALGHDAVCRIFTDQAGAVEELEEVISLIEYRLDKWNKVEDAIQLADAYNSMGMALMRGKVPREEAAISWWAKSFESFGEIAVPGDDATLAAKIRQEWPAMNLATVFTLRGNPDEAEAILLPVIEAKKEKLGENFNGYMASGRLLHTLASVRLAQGSTTESEELYLEAMGILSRTIGPDHPITADTDYRYAHFLFTRPLISEMLKYYLRDALRTYLGRDSASTGGAPGLRPQFARAAFLLGHYLVVEAESHSWWSPDSIAEGIERGEYWLEVAARAWREMNPRGDKRKHRGWRYLKLEDFDKMVWYFSR